MQNPSSSDGGQGCTPEAFQTNTFCTNEDTDKGDSGIRFIRLRGWQQLDGYSFFQGDKRGSDKDLRYKAKKIPQIQELNISYLDSWLLHNTLAERDYIVGKI